MQYTVVVETTEAALIKSAGPTAQPTFQPVAENNLPPLKTEIVRFQLSSMDANKIVYLPSNTRYSYTSSLRITRFG
jgi:hypothetical protein